MISLSGHYFRYFAGHCIFYDSVCIDQHHASIPIMCQDFALYLELGTLDAKLIYITQYHAFQDSESNDVQLVWG
jgi:hypothetical protein